MDRNFAIERNRGDLLGLVMGLFAKVGLAEGGLVERLPRPVYRRVLRVLRKAEAAVRRLIVVMAHDIKVEPRPKRPKPAGLFRSRTGRFQGKGQTKAANQGQDQRKSRPPSFNLFERQLRCDAGRARRRRRKYNGPEPRIRILDYDPRIPEAIWPRSPPPTPAPQRVEIVKDTTVSAKRLCRRLFAIVRALTNMEREAKRLALWQATPKEERRPRRDRPLRYGWPPGWRTKSSHDVDDILKNCHWLVRDLPEPDTS